MRARAWPDADFVAQVKQDFMENGMYKPVANAEESRALISLGYTLIDVRDEQQVEKRGKVRCSTHVPYYLAKKVWIPEEKTTRIDLVVNDKFLDQIARIPQLKDKEKALIMVMDLNGREESGGIAALERLESAGYQNLVGVVGGFSSFWRTWDAKLQRRPSRGAFVEDPYSNGSSQGLFAGES